MAWKNFRAWYNEVKSGKKTFSFKGQAVEYRFKPDGTWDTISIANPPDDAVVYPFQKTEKHQTDAASTSPDQTKEEDQKRPWLWVVLGVLLLIFVMLGLRQRRRLKIDA